MTSPELASTQSPANLIDGRWMAPVSGGAYERHSPARRSLSLGAYPLSTPADVDLAVAAATAAAPGWAALPMARRADALQAVGSPLKSRAPQLAERMSVEMGKPVRESLPEVHRAVAVLSYYAGEAYRATGERFEQAGSGSAVLTLRRPKGVVALITPWNFPVAIPVWKIAPALIYGNTLIWKYSEESPWTSRAVLECFAEAGLPPGVVNGIGGTGQSIGDSLVASAGVDAISFTGSIGVGRAIRAAAPDSPAQLELDGQNALIVAADADLGRAVEAAYAGAFWCAGQKCTSTRRIYVQRPVYASFRARLAERIAGGVVGDPLDAKTEVGPLVSETQWQRVRQAVSRGIAEGGSVVSAAGDFEDGWYLSPTLFENVGDAAYLSREEVFGPVASLYAFDTVGEAIERANAVPYGLSMALFSQSLVAVHKFLRRAEAGVLHVNSPTPGTEVPVPFGGLKSSGWGPHEQGRAAREFYTDSVTVYQDS
jgi:acyl-CoA reductase-like NAD-dependent aldehyde dehydrogenase